MDHQLLKKQLREFSITTLLPLTKQAGLDAVAPVCGLHVPLHFCSRGFFSFFFSPLSWHMLRKCCCCQSLCPLQKKTAEKPRKRKGASGSGLHKNVEQLAVQRAKTEIKSLVCMLLCAFVFFHCCNSRLLLLFSGNQRRGSIEAQAGTGAAGTSERAPVGATAARPQGPEGLREEGAYIYCILRFWLLFLLANYQLSHAR
jgi:hypothetical protein